MYSHYCDKINEVCIAKLHVAIATSIVENGKYVAI